MLDDFGPLAGISGLIFAVVLVVLIDNIISRVRGNKPDDDDKQRRY